MSIELIVACLDEALATGDATHLRVAEDVWQDLTDREKAECLSEVKHPLGGFFDIVRDEDPRQLLEAAVEEAILLTEDHTKALAKLNAAKYHQDLCQALVDALDHKKKALESLAYLHGQNYFSAPKEPKSTPAMDAAAAKAAMKKKLKS